MPARFAYIDGAQDVAAGVEYRIGHRRSSVDLCSEVKDHVRTGAGNDADKFRRLNVATHQRESTWPSVIEAVGPFQVGGDPRVEIVDSHDLVTVVQKTVDQIRPDEPGGAGDEQVHAPSLRSTAVSARPQTQAAAFGSVVVVTSGTVDSVVGAGLESAWVGPSAAVPVGAGIAVVIGEAIGKRGGRTMADLRVAVEPGEHVARRGTAQSHERRESDSGGEREQNDAGDAKDAWRELPGACPGCSEKQDRDRQRDYERRPHALDQKRASRPDRERRQPSAVD